MDPWMEFAARATVGSGPSFYFERGPSPGRPSRWAVQGFNPEERILWTRSSDIRKMRDELLASELEEQPPLLFGYVGFDAVGLFEPALARSTPSGSPFPAAEFHSFRQWTRRGLPRGPPKSSPSFSEDTEVGLSTDTATRETFTASVVRLKRDILDGEAFQVVLAHRKERRRSGSLLPVVDRLRRGERYAYLYYLRTNEIEIAGASHESVVEVSRGNVAKSPIAGTRKGRRPW